MEAGLQDGWIVGRGILPTAREEHRDFSSVNHLAIVIAAVAAWLASAIWYMSLSGLYTAALGKTPEQMAEDRKKPGAFLPYVYALVANVIIAGMLAGPIWAPGR
jgi:hypothetical protein